MTCTPYVQQYTDHCLPHTGLNLSWIALAAVLTILVGAGLIALTRAHNA